MLSEYDIQQWLVRQLAASLHLEPELIDIREPFAHYGLSSGEAVSLSGELEELLGRRLSPTLVYEYPSIFTLAQFLVQADDHADISRVGNPLPDEHPEPKHHEAVAIIGISCRFPGAKDPDAFWELLRTGTDAITAAPEERKNISQWGGFLENIDQFDPFFFGISPVEAAGMDPQQRLLMELSWELLDDANLNKDAITGTDTGVFIGIALNEYSQLQLGNTDMLTSHSGTGNALSIAANRISYYYDLHGPSMAIDTACSSSLSALHLACKSLRDGECSMAIAGGVNIMLSPVHAIAFTKAGVLSPDGRCKAFDARANGYVRGEGGGLVLLKPLEAALRDGDTIHAVIRGSAMRQDGRTNGLMAPSRESQEALLVAACQQAGVAPSHLQYVETHGTGTLLGDAMEAAALGAVMGRDRIVGPCIIGTVKSNIGHLEAAAGIAGLIKVILSMRHKMIPASLHYLLPNPHLAFDTLHLQVQQIISAWPLNEGTALAGVSSFGFGGTNVHVIISKEYKTELPDAAVTGNDTAGVYLLPLSSGGEQALRQLADQFRVMLSDSSLSVRAICSAAAWRRSQQFPRIAVMGNNREQMIAGLTAFQHGLPDTGLTVGDEAVTPNRRLAFIFPGQGGQWPGMGRELLRSSPVFAGKIRELDSLMQQYQDWSLEDYLQCHISSQNDQEIDIIQPAIFAIQVGLAAVFGHWGITPDAVAGHSMGEVAAAQVAGKINLEDAVRIICRRSQLMRRLRGQGGMLATGLSAAEAGNRLKKYNNLVDIAALNSPESTVLTGDIAALASLTQTLQQEQIFCKPVNVDIASHSSQVDAIRTDLLDALKELHPVTGSLPLYSTVTGTLLSDLKMDAVYWMDNLRKPVLFSSAASALQDDGYTDFIEIGPHPILLGALQQVFQSGNSQLNLLPALRRETPATEVLYEVVRRLYTSGYPVRWEGLYPQRPPLHLPLMPWQRQRYWLEATAPFLCKENQTVHPLLGESLQPANASGTLIWQKDLQGNLPSWLQDHRIDGQIIFPAAAFIEMALQVRKEAGLANNYLPGSFRFLKKLILQKGVSTEVQTILEPGKEKEYLLTIYSRVTRKDKWILHTTATFRRQAEMPAAVPSVFAAENCSCISIKDFYQRLFNRGLEYGEAFRGLCSVSQDGNTILGRTELPGNLQQEAYQYQLHPALLDACLQVMAIHPAIDKGRFLPEGCDSVQIHAAPAGLLYCRVPITAKQPVDQITENIYLYSSDLMPVATIKGFRLHRVAEDHHSGSEQRTWQYHQEWQLQDEEPGAKLLTGNHRWLILADEGGLAVSTAAQLEAAGNTVTVIYSNDRNALTSLWQECQRTDPLYGVIHLWSLSIPSQSDAQEYATERQYDLGVNSVLSLVQLLSQRPGASPRLWLVTRGAQCTAPGEQVSVEQAALWGLGKVISFEFPDLQCIRIDLDGQLQNGQEAAILLRHLMMTGKEDQLAFRKGKRFVLRLVPHQSTQQEPPALQFREEATYLITGGMGALGLCMANWMVDHGARYLVLMGRSEPTDAVLTNTERLKERGVSVVLAQADVSDGQQVEALFARMEEALPPLRGVIHAAGLLDDGALLNLDATRMRKVMAPKVEGTLHLHQATQHLQLDFFVLFSSVVSLLGAPGQGNYAAASASLDAMANYRRSRGLPAVSINWGPWADVGLAAAATHKLIEKQAPVQHLIKVIGIEDGLSILSQLLYASVPQVAVLPFDVKNLLELYPAAAHIPYFTAIQNHHPVTGRHYNRPRLRQAYIAPETTMEHQLAALWQQTLHIDCIGVLDSFFELGGDSVLAAQLLSRAQQSFGTRIDPQEAFQSFTIRHLAAKLESALISNAKKAAQPTIPPRSPGMTVPLSFPQKRLLFLELLEPGTSINNLSAFYELHGDLDTDALHFSVNQVLQRHDALRTKFLFPQGMPVPAWQEKLSLSIPVIPLTHLSGTEALSTAKKMAAKEVRLPFNLQDAPLIRLRLYSLTEQSHCLLVVVHHAIADGWSLGVFLKELMYYYEHFQNGSQTGLPDLPLQYADYAAWLQQEHQGKEHPSTQYWKQKLSGNLPLLELPTDFTRGARQSYNGASHHFTLERNTVKAIEQVAGASSATPFMVMLSAYAMLLHRYSGQEEIIIGTPVANRNLPELENLIGVLINSLPLRIQLPEAITFEMLLVQVRTTCLEALAHQDYPFEKIVETVQPDRDLSRSPVYQTIFNLQNVPVPEMNLPGLAITPLDVDGDVAQFDLSFMVIPSAGDWRCQVTFNTDLFAPATITAMFSSYIRLLESALAEPTQQVSKLPLLDEDTYQFLVNELNDTAEVYPDAACLHGLFEAQVLRTPDAIAVKDSCETLSYAELNRRAERLAAQLCACGAGPEFRIGIHLEKSVSLVVALLGTHKAGGAYLPIAPSLPQERKAFMIRDAALQLLLTESDGVPLESAGLPILYLQRGGRTAEQVSSMTATKATQDNLAYILYTSGSTGLPKGVMITHAALTNFIQSMQRRPGICSHDVLLSVTPISFDIMALEIFLPLVTGATVILVEKETATQSLLLAEAIERHGVTLMQATPATWQLLLDSGWKGAPALTALCGGDVLTRKLADRLLDKVAQLWNLYGPTETTIWSSLTTVKRDSAPITIGQPIANTQLYVLDALGQPLPAGVIGELHIGGKGLARGYCGQPALTTAKFVSRSFNHLPPTASVRLYKTGDRARYLADGSIELIGRWDDQVKINGHRVEPAEANAQLLQHPEVRDAVTIVEALPSGEKRLIAYLVTDYQNRDWASWLRSRLPAYMIPAIFIPLETLPLTPNGKINRAALPLAATQLRQPGYAAPVGIIENQLAGIWENVLLTAPVGRHDNFFSLGGASMQSLQAVAHANAAGIALQPADLFEYQTIAELAAHLEKSSPVGTNHEYNEKAEYGCEKTPDRNEVAREEEIRHDQ
ncbi:hybrid non-ribosomal peptide synthetase/type I polyketide synthase [Flavihumibacter petaseus]|uniref:Polyketide synthase/non-ribosomal peptide synthetase n=1 Tax=Flavihumibacter petaseus NBRC 106054 TaxID=1220578 RepID=A0A0E9MVL3_9BACT|nr:hybrid non-ribosomal peptide synthetase/type I polyketide synthase [Flavihumibacter petaseus]GAO41451.1 polyketide synthase/non-ribosomal peptide synthetase [Flavihumibacter petaseus NBRC 106054]